MAKELNNATRTLQFLCFMWNRLFTTKPQRLGRFNCRVANWCQLVTKHIGNSMDSSLQPNDFCLLLITVLLIKIYCLGWFQKYSGQSSFPLSWHLGTVTKCFQSHRPILHCNSVTKNAATVKLSNPIFPSVTSYWNRNMLNGTEISNASCLFPDMSCPNLIQKKFFIH